MPTYRAASPPEAKSGSLVTLLYDLLHASTTYEAFIEALSKREFTPVQNKRVGEFLEVALVYFPPNSEPRPL